MTISLQQLSFGILFSFFLALGSFLLSNFLFELSPLIIAILLGFLFGNLFSFSPKKFQSGFDFSTTKILRFAIVLYGFNITFQDIYQVGVQGFITSVFIVISTLVLGYFVATRYFELDKHLALLISSGSAICGAAAILAVESVLKSDANKTSIAISTVVIFGTISMFLYPLFFHAGFIPLPENIIGTYIGSTLHEVAHVVTAGASVSTEAANDAVIVKMIRVMMLAPVLLAIPLFVSTTEEKKKLSIPWFAIFFIVIAIFNSFGFLSSEAVATIKQIDIFLLSMAMGALGIKTKFKALLKVGAKPFVFAFILFLWLVFGGFGINFLFTYNV